MTMAYSSSAGERSVSWLLLLDFHSFSTSAESCMLEKTPMNRLKPGKPMLHSKQVLTVFPAACRQRPSDVQPSEGSWRGRHNHG
jgi:hypothetical protein